MENKPPHFLILGAQKCGTTALFSYLEQHPGIAPARLKEICFFSKDVLYKQTASQYVRYFNTSGGKATFDATPEYLYYPFTAERIHAYNPHLRLLVLLRDPIRRAFSSWNMFRQWFDISNKKAVINYHLQKVNPEYRQGYTDLMFSDSYPDFHTCIRKEVDSLVRGEAPNEPGFVARGLYSRQIARFLRYFQRSQILIIHNEDLKQNTMATLNEICDFLSLQRIEWASDKLTPVHAIDYNVDISAESIELLKNFYEEENRSLETLLGRQFRLGENYFHQQNI